MLSIELIALIEERHPEIRDDPFWADLTNHVFKLERMAIEGVVYKHVFVRMEG